MVNWILHNLRLAATMLLAFLIDWGGGNVMAQQFSVKKFEAMPNDISAFVDPVKDLNDEGCALIKVVASEDFAFSSPLGIVKRKDEVGEIWLYLPRNSKYLTIKHPEWGIIRNYKFPHPLESHITYEMTISQPQSVALRDTLVLTKTVVDTITIEKPKLPLSFDALATTGFHKNGPSWGLMLLLMRRHGIFIHAQTDFRSIGSTTSTCDEQGYIDSSMPYYSGETKHSNYLFTAGAIHRLSSTLRLFEGIGYGRSATAWQLAESEGGGYALNDGLTHKGVAAEVGLMATMGRMRLSLSCATIEGKQWQAIVGIGIKINGR